MPIASAPPLPPSPVTTARIGVRRAAISRRLRAIASACPRSSAPSPGEAPGVSMNVMTGQLRALPGRQAGVGLLTHAGEPLLELRDLVARLRQTLLGLEGGDARLHLEQRLLEVKRVRHSPR